VERKKTQIVHKQIMMTSTRSLHFVKRQSPTMLKNHLFYVSCALGKRLLQSSSPTFALFPECLRFTNNDFISVRKITANPRKAPRVQNAIVSIPIGATAYRLDQPTNSCQEIFTKLDRTHQTAFFSSISSKENDDEDVTHHENEQSDDFRSFEDDPNALKQSATISVCLNENSKEISFGGPSEECDLEHKTDGRDSISSPISLQNSDVVSSQLTGSSAPNEDRTLNHDAHDYGHKGKDAIGGDVIYDGNYSDERAAKEDSTIASKTSLEDLLQTDIFSLSWADTTSPSNITERSHYVSQRHDYNSQNVRSSRNLQSNHNHGSESIVELLQSDSCDGSLSSDPWATRRSAESMSVGQLSHAELKFNSIINESAALLRELSLGNESMSSSTLQLMDFDKVMTELSQFHSLVDSEEARRNQSTHGFSYGHTKNEKAPLKHNASDTCLQLLDELESNYDVIFENSMLSANADSNSNAVKHPKLMPNAVSYNLALHALAHSGKGRRVALDAYSILNRMIDRCKKYIIAFEKVATDGTDMKLPPPPPEPSIITYNSVIHAISKSGANDAGHLAEEVFSLMENWKNECEERNGGSDCADYKGNGDNDQSNFYIGVLPNVRTLACLLNAWANTNSGRQSTFAPERTESILEYSIQKRRAYLDYVCGVREFFGVDSIENEEYVNSYSGGVDHIVEDMEMYNFPSDVIVEEKQLSREFQPNGDFFDEIQCESNLTKSDTLLSPSISGTAKPFPRPTAVIFNTCLDAWAQSGRGLEAAVRAKEILDRMEALASSGELNLPDENCLGSPKGGVDDNEDDSSEADSSMKPNSRTYSIVMNAFSRIPWRERGAGEDAASQCEAILSRMEERAANGESSLRPNLMHYTTAISAWARMRNLDYAASRAENILNRMIDLYYSGMIDELPTFDGDSKRSGKHDAPFNAVITAYARSKDPFAAERAISILDRLQSSPITPTLTTFNAAIDVCAKRGKADSAIGIFNQIRNAGLTPDATSYNTVLDAFARGDDATRQIAPGISFARWNVRSQRVSLMWRRQLSDILQSSMLMRNWQGRKKTVELMLSGRLKWFTTNYVRE